MVLVKEEDRHHHPKLAEELSGVETEPIILGSIVMENELSDTQRTASDASNSNIPTGITGVPTTVDEAPELVIYE